MLSIYVSSFSLPLSFLGSDSETFGLAMLSCICMNYIIYVKHALVFSISDRFRLSQNITLDNFSEFLKIICRESDKWEYIDIVSRWSTWKKRYINFSSSLFLCTYASLPALKTGCCYLWNWKPIFRSLNRCQLHLAIGEYSKDGSVLWLSVFLLKHPVLLPISEKSLDIENAEWWVKLVEEIILFQPYFKNS